jgi:hypothetical protein
MAVNEARQQLALKKEIEQAETKLRPYHVPVEVMQNQDLRVCFQNHVPPELYEWFRLNGWQRDETVPTGRYVYTKIHTGQQVGWWSVGLALVWAGRVVMSFVALSYIKSKLFV